MGRTNIKCQNGPVLPPAQVFYLNGQALFQKAALKLCGIVKIQAYIGTDSGKRICFIPCYDYDSPFYKIYWKVFLPLIS
jgi:hypothetical protein